MPDQHSSPPLQVGKGVQPEHILIVGGGEFGLSAALALLRRPRFKTSRITLLEQAEQLPNPSGSSVDASRIIRADYAARPYAALAASAQVLWRDVVGPREDGTEDGGWGGAGRYTESGFVLTADSKTRPSGGGGGGGQNLEQEDHDSRESAELDLEGYVALARENVKDVAAEVGRAVLDPDKIETLSTKAAIQRATGYDRSSGDSGYANWNSGWADAEAVVKYAVDRLKHEGRGSGGNNGTGDEDRVTIRTGAEVEQLLVNDNDADADVDDGIQKKSRCSGVQLTDGSQIHADLTILAAGAWTPSLIDLEGRCLATGQVLTYLSITDAEQEEMRHRPVIMNLSRGMFIIPPRGNELKVARHGFGYTNPRRVRFHDGTVKMHVSVPRVGISVPEEGQIACRDALAELIPSMADRPWSNTRLCWYCDTPDGDFLIDHHPDIQDLVVATGGSGHGFKFFPVIGDKIVDRIEGTLDHTYAELWKFKPPVPGFTGCDDGSRAGRQGMTLDEEMRISSWKMGT